MNIAIVGGGPVGLTLAIKLIYKHPFEKNSNVSPKYTIDIYEKRKKYTRDQFIVSGGTKGNLLRNYPRDLVKLLRNNFSCYIDNPVVDMHGFCFESSNYGTDFENFSQVIEINKLEKILSKYIKKTYKKQIKIINKEFTTDKINKYNIIIGTDGQKSFVREKIMNVKWTNLKEYETYILHIKYNDLSNKKYRIGTNILSNELKKAYNLKLKRNDYSSYEKEDKLDEKQKFEQDRFRLIRSNTNKTQFLLQINKATYNRIKNIKIVNNLPNNLKNAILIDSFIMGSVPKKINDEKITCYNTKVGHSEKYAIIKDKKLFILFGDSAMTTHVFTGEGLNIFFDSPKKLIESYISNNKFDSALKRYNISMHSDFINHIKYKALLRYIPHKLLKNICSKVTLVELTVLLDNELEFYEYEELINNLQKKYKNISNNEIKNELCLILRDKVLKYFTYKLK